jgi:hypothetical protein
MFFIDAAIAPNKTETNAIKSSLFDSGISLSMSMIKIYKASPIIRKEPKKDKMINTLLFTISI